MSSDGNCNICGQPSHLMCGNCHSVSYCCKDHQKQDWKNHRPDCPAYKIVTNDTVGRHLVATRAISEGEIILKESPIVCGPEQVTPPVCLGCYDLLTEFNKRDCSKCGWPVCSEICEKSQAHRPECEITSRHKNGKVEINTLTKGVAHPSYQCLTVLRCLYLKSTEPHLWEKLMNLESHCEERKSTAKYISDLMFIAEFIPNFLNYSDFSSEEILRVAGIVQVNAHEIPLREPGYVAIYDKASFLEHSCRANCMKSVTNSGQLVIRAAEKISPGDHLSICYTDPLWGRDMRIGHLLESKFFRCQCPRCSDTTEFGTHFNSLKCTNRNCNGYLIPTPDPPEKPTAEKSAAWKCKKCEKSLTEEEKGQLTADIYDSLPELNKKDAKSCVKFLDKFEKILHPNHHILVGVKLALIDLFGWQDEVISLKDSDLEWTIKTCREMCGLAKSLVPAENRLRGVLLYQLHFGLVEHGRRKAARLEFDASQVRKNLLECKDILLKAYNLLRYEPDELPEGKMAIEAKKAVANLYHYLQNSEPKFL